VSYKAEERQQDNAFTGQKGQSLPANNYKPGKRNGTDLPLQPSEATSPADTYVLEF
jgi:hypothetical protein